MFPLPCVCLSVSLLLCVFVSVLSWAWSPAASPPAHLRLIKQATAAHKTGPSLQALPDPLLNHVTSSFSFCSSAYFCVITLLQWVFWLWTWLSCFFPLHLRRPRAITQPDPLPTLSLSHYCCDPQPATLQPPPCSACLNWNITFLYFHLVFPVSVFFFWVSYSTHRDIHKLCSTNSPLVNTWIDERLYLQKYKTKFCKLWYKLTC